jgi:glycosyltransferase involved in cell wall biosynthesis
MHIAFLSLEYPPLPSGGIGTSVQNLARALVRQGHRVTVLGWGPETEFDDGGVRVRFLGHTSIPRMGWFLNRRRLQRELRRLKKTEGLDIVEAHDWCGISAGLRPDCPLVVRCHGSATYFARLLDESVRPTVFGTEWLALIGADAVVAVSRFTAGLTAGIFRLPQRVGTIPNGIDTSRFHPADGNGVEQDVILYCGSVVRKKGVLDLSRIFSLVVDKYPPAKLWVIGRDTVDKKTGARSTWDLCWELLSPAARKRVEYFGPQPPERVPAYIQQSRVCVFPSYAEALPLSWLEAMACGKPIVAYDIGWASEVVESGVSGILIPIGDVEQAAASMAAFLPDSGRALALGRAARQRIESLFTIDSVAERTVQWYRNVIKLGGEAPSCPEALEESNPTLGQRPERYGYGGS